MQPPQPQTPHQVIEAAEFALDQTMPGWRDELAAGRIADELRIAVVRVRALTWLMANASPLAFIRPAPRTPVEGAQAVCALARIFLGSSPPEAALEKLESAVGGRLPDWRESLARDVPDGLDELRLTVARLDGMLLLMGPDPLAAIRTREGAPPVDTPERGAQRVCWFVRQLLDGFQCPQSPTEQAIVALTNEALPHMQDIGDFISAIKQPGGVPITLEQFETYVNHVEAFRAIRNRMPDSEVRDTWDLTLYENDALIRKTRRNLGGAA